MFEPRGEPDGLELVHLHRHDGVGDDSEAHPGDRGRERVEGRKSIVVQPPGTAVFRDVRGEPGIRCRVGAEVEVKRGDEIAGAGAPLIEEPELAAEVPVVVELLELLPARELEVVVGVGEGAAVRAAVGEHPGGDGFRVLEQRVVEVEENHPRYLCAHAGQPVFTRRSSSRCRMPRHESGRVPSR